MDQTTVIIAAAAGLSGSLVPLFVSLRKLAGTVKHSEAEQLWAASEAMRKELEQRNRYLRDRLDKCEASIDDLEKQVRALTDKNLILVEENYQLKRAV